MAAPGGGGRDRRPQPDVDDNQTSDASTTSHDSRTDSSEDVFGDEFASEYAPSIATMSDPFGNDGENDHDHDHDYDRDHDHDTPSQPDTTTPSVDLRNPFEPTQPPTHHEPHENLLRPRRSMRKSSHDRDRSEGRTEDDEVGHLVVPGLHGLGARDSFSSRSFTSGNDAEGVTAATSSPSHPYGDYSQLGDAAGPGVAAHDLQRHSVVQPSPHTHGPAHPYALYPQDVSVADIAVPEAIHLGFPRHLQHFQPIVDPTAQGQGMAGADEHSEQLPPYSRYPEQSRISTAAAAAPIGTATPHSPLSPLPQQPQPPRPSGSPISPLSPLGVHSLPPPPQQQQQMQVQQARSPFEDPPAGHSPAGSSQSSPTGEMAERHTTASYSTLSEKAPIEKTWREKSVKEKGRTKFLGVRLWVILLLFSVIAFVVIFCATFISVFLRQKREDVPYIPPKNATNHNGGVTTVTYIDASPTSSTSGLPSLPSGTFRVPLGPPDVVYNSCVTGAQADTWTCTMPGQKTICIFISETLDGRSYLSTCDNGYPLMYGSQPPFLIQQTLKLVTDLDNTTLGPAWHFQTFYDKVVVLPQSFLAQPASSKRDVSGAPPTAKVKRQTQSIPSNTTISPGEEAWFCNWDDTFMEAFIYVEINNPGPAAPSSYVWSDWGTSLAYSTPSAADFGGASVPLTDASITQPTLSPSSTTGQWSNNRRDALNARDPQILSDLRPLLPVAFHTGPDAQHPSWYQHWHSANMGSGLAGDEYGYATSGSLQTTSGGDSTASATTAITTTSGTSTILTTGSTTMTTSSSSSSSTSQPMVIPKLMRIEERRLKGLHDIALCQLLVKMPDQSFQTVMDAWDVPIVVALDEDDGPLVVQRSLERVPMQGVGGGAALAKRQRAYEPVAVDQTCYCEWTSEQFD